MSKHEREFLIVFLKHASFYHERVKIINADKQNTKRTQLTEQLQDFVGDISIYSTWWCVNQPVNWSYFSLILITTSQQVYVMKQWPLLSRHSTKEEKKTILLFLFFPYTYQYRFKLPTNRKHLLLFLFLNDNLFSTCQDSRQWSGTHTCTLMYMYTNTRIQTLMQTVSQVKVMDLKNVLISCLYNTISILSPSWKLCVCMCMECVHAYIGIMSSTHSQSARFCTESQGGNWNSDNTLNHLNPPGVGSTRYSTIMFITFSTCHSHPHNSMFCLT